MSTAESVLKTGVARRNSMTILDLPQRLTELGGKETPLAIYLTKVPWAEEIYLHTINKPAEPEIRAAVLNDLEFPP